ncbi:MAG: acyl carrier protein [Paracoccaceae bacterium]
MQQTTADRVRKVIQGHLVVDEAPDVAHIINDLGADSLDTVELVMGLEEEFGIEIPNDEMLALGTVGEAIALIERFTGEPSI